MHRPCPAKAPRSETLINQNKRFMRHFRRHFCLLLALSAAPLVGLTGCGKSSDDPPIVSVAGQTVSKASLEHWIPIEAVIDHQSLPQAPVPKGEIPDPPRYAACIAYLAAHARTSTATQGAITKLALKGQCQARYRHVREHMLQILITYAWLRAEAAELNVHVSHRDVMQAFTRYKREVFKTDAAFRRYLRYTKSTLADELLIGQMDLLSTKIEQKVIAERGLSGARSYYHELPKRWAAKTDCSPAYVILNCKQYKGPHMPEAVV